MPTLEPQTRPVHERPWVLVHAAGLGCVLIGVISFALTAWSHFDAGRGLTETPDPWLPISALVLAVIAGIASLLRGEGAKLLPLVGMGLAASAMVVGIALVLWAIGLVTLGVILILSEVI